MNGPIALLLAALAVGPVPSAPLTQPAPQPTAPAVSDGVLQAVVGDRVVVTAGADEKTGVLRSVAADRVVLVGDDGAVFEVERAVITAVKLAPAAAPLAPAEPASAPLVTPVVGMCMGDESCEHPRKCIEGQCRIDPLYVDALEEEGHARRTHGFRALIAGAAVGGAGLVIMLTGVGLYVHHADCENAETFDEFDRCSAVRSRRAVGAAIAGGVITFVGGVIMAGGGGAYAVGKKKLGRVGQYRKSLGFDLSPSRNGLQFGVHGRF